MFRAMLEGPMAEDRKRHINIQDVDPRAFEILISFMTGDAVRFQSVPTALNVIYAAKKYMVGRIDDLALKFIYKNINTHNVLLVLQNLVVLQVRPGGVEPGAGCPGGGCGGGPLGALPGPPGAGGEPLQQPGGDGGGPPLPGQPMGIRKGISARETSHAKN